MLGFGFSGFKGYLATLRVRIRTETKVKVALQKRYQGQVCASQRIVP